MTRRTLTILLLLLVAALAATILYCVRQDRSGEASAGAAQGTGPSAEMMGAMHRMHDSVNRTAMTGDIDRDFVTLMVPHHQSAVEMARTYLQHGKDPELRRLSESIIASQEAEIRQMRGRGPAPAPAPGAAQEAAPHEGH